MEHILEVQDLHTSFLTSSGEVKAVRGVSFTVNKGESVGIVGESGSGKSVTSLSVMQLLVGTGRITSGSVKLNGRELVGLSPKEMRNIRGKEVAMIFQDPMTSLNPLIPVGEQVGEMLWSHDKTLSKTEREARVVELFHMVRIPEAEKRLKSYPHEFSGGMRQRVMIAMALACKPDLLIADEPTTALDVSIQDQILKLMRSIQREMGMSIMFITHDLGVVAELCSRVLVMYGGLIMEEAGIFDIFEKPLHPYTMALFSAIPVPDPDYKMNRIVLQGSIPSPANPPSGCKFHTRCEKCMEICKTVSPEMREVEPGHFCACHLYDPDASQ